MSIKPSKKSAFTLVEVVLAVIILGLLGSVLFTLVESTLGAAAQLNTKQNQTQELNGLIEVCRKTFSNLDGRSFLTASVKPAPGGGYVQEIRVENGPLAFAWQGNGSETGVTTISPRPQANGLLAFCLRHELDQTDLQRPEITEPAKWFVLVRDLKKMEWRFFDSRSATWRKEWEEGAFRPSLIELIIHSPASPEEVRVVFNVLPSLPSST